MATKKIIKTIFQFRRATFDEWEANRPITPAEGEPCFITDQNILKIGDGVTEFGELEPINGAKIEIAADEKSIVMNEGTFSLFGFGEAEAGAQPRKTAEGAIEWVVPVDVTGFDEIKEDVATLKEGVKTLQDIVGEVEGENPLVSRVATLETSVGILNGSETIEGSVKQIVKDEIDKFATEATANDTIDRFVELVEYVAEHGGQVETMLTGIADLQAKVGEKTVEEQIQEALQESIPSNIIEGAKIGETLLDIVDKKIVIPVGAGLKSSDEIEIEPDGTLRIKAMSWDKLMDGETEIVMDGGSAV